MGTNEVFHALVENLRNLCFKAHKGIFGLASWWLRVDATFEVISIHLILPETLRHQQGSHSSTLLVKKDLWMPPNPDLD